MWGLNLNPQLVDTLVVVLLGGGRCFKNSCLGLFSSGSPTAAAARVRPDLEARLLRLLSNPIFSLSVKLRLKKQLNNLKSECYDPRLAPPLPPLLPEPESPPQGSPQQSALFRLLITRTCDFQQQRTYQQGDCNKQRHAFSINRTNNQVTPTRKVRLFLINEKKKREKKTFL